MVNHPTAPLPRRARLRARHALIQALARVGKLNPQRQWLREVCWNDMHRTFTHLGPERLDVAEISGAHWAGFGWASHRTLNFPEFDLCEPPSPLPALFDLVICEQVLEHVRNPLAATRTLRELCRPGGHVLVATPFLVALHDYPGDYWRFTPDGLALLLRSQGLEPLWVRSWGNRSVVRANFDGWVSRLPWENLRNEPRLPAVVWSLAQPAAHEDHRAGARGHRLDRNCGTVRVRASTGCPRSGSCS